MSLGVLGSEAQERSVVGATAARERSELTFSEPNEKVTRAKLKGPTLNPAGAGQGTQRRILSICASEAKFRQGMEENGMRRTRIELATFGLKDRRSLVPVKGPVDH